MSINFSAFNNAAGAAAAPLLAPGPAPAYSLYNLAQVPPAAAGNRRTAPEIIAIGLGWPNAATVRDRWAGGAGGALTIVIPATTLAFATLANHVHALTSHWWVNGSEMERRSLINGTVAALLGRAEFAGDGIILEHNIQRQNVNRTLVGGQQIGHGPLDYLLSPPSPFGAGAVPPGMASLPAAAALAGPAPQWPNVLAIEAKADLGAGRDTGQWQLCAQMATIRQLGVGAGVALNFVRGILTDGRFWRFYQLDVANQRFDRTQAYDIAAPGGGGGGGGAAGERNVLRLLRKFILNRVPAVDIWP